MLRNFILLFFFLFLLSGCVDENFYQQNALHQPSNKQEAASESDSVWVVAGRHYDRSGFFRFFWGDHYREIWNTPVRVKVFNIQEEAGGLRLHKIGGGFQTTSFQLLDTTGRLFAFRSLDKDPVPVLPGFWQKTFAANVVRDQTSSSNPFGMLIVPVLAEAVGVYHTNPKLFYVATNDSSFGIHTDRVRGKLFMLEEKHKNAINLPPAMAHVHDFISSDDALRLRYASNHYRFDQKAFARARLLDLFIGDWDRHKGQWDWAVVAQQGDTIFEPIPKDRDQVFLKMGDGLIPAIATSKLLARKFTTFNKNISDVKALMMNARFIDSRLLHELPKETWLALARDMQANLTDKVIAQAVKQLPPPVYKQIGEKLIQDLKSRRAQLPEAAAEMYALLAEKVTIPGTDQSEIFVVNRLNDTQTQVQVLRPKTRKIFYNRTFNHSETKEIILHGLRGNDEFLVQGKVNKGILIKIYGGMGEDKITDSSEVSNWKKMTHIYDTERGNEIDFGNEARNRTTRDVKVHVYDQEGN